MKFELILILLIAFSSQKRINQSNISEDGKRLDRKLVLVKRPGVGDSSLPSLIKDPAKKDLIVQKDPFGNNLKGTYQVGDRHITPSGHPTTFKSGMRSVGKKHKKQ